MKFSKYKSLRDTPATHATHARRLSSRQKPVYTIIKTRLSLRATNATVFGGMFLKIGGFHIKHKKGLHWQVFASRVATVYINI